MAPPQDVPLASFIRKTFLSRSKQFERDSRYVSGNFPKMHKRPDYGYKVTKRGNADASDVRPKFGRNLQRRTPFDGELISVPSEFSVLPLFLSLGLVDTQEPGKVERSLELLSVSP